MRPAASDRRRSQIDSGSPDEVQPGTPVGVAFDTGHIRIEEITKTFLNQKDGSVSSVPCRDISLDIPRGSFTSIVGPSGCGKSTLLNVIAGLIRPDSGRVVIGQHEVNGPVKKIGYVTQDSNLLPWKTVRQNVELPLRIQGIAKQDRQQRATDWLSLVSLIGSDDLYPAQLSGGMQKRVSIARALVYDPSVVLMDEPFGPLDALTRMVLQQNLLDIWDRPRGAANSDATVVFVTHDLNEAIILSDQVIVMDRNPGRIRAVLDVDLPRPRKVAETAELPGFSSIHHELWNQVKKSLDVN
jgi:NitT/TauT family transport system ATP-binding protein